MLLQYKYSNYPIHWSHSGLFMLCWVSTHQVPHWTKGCGGHFLTDSIENPHYYITLDITTTVKIGIKNKNIWNHHLGILCAFKPCSSQQPPTDKNSQRPLNGPLHIIHLCEAQVSIVHIVKRHLTSLVFYQGGSPKSPMEFNTKLYHLP